MLVISFTAIVIKMLNIVSIVKKMFNFLIVSIII
jgi:hypothetical protein